ncbi:RHS repeat protein [Salmonella enterica]|nr:RHS repeat protein [Salmonella enterica]
MMTFMSLNLKIINNLSITEKFRQQANATFPPELVAMVDSLEADLQRRELSEPNRAWLAQGGLTPEQIQNQMEPEYTPQRKIHLYHCDHRGLPLALVNVEGKADWSAEYDAWGNMLRENSPHNLVQHIRLPGQQYDEETGLYYNRHRYYDPLQGQYITQDPIGMMGGWNPYIYPLNPVMDIDPLGLMAFGGEFGKWAGSAVNAASEGHMSYEDATAAIDAANGPTYSSLLFSLSLDVGLSAYGITGGSVAAGILTGNGDNGLDLCAYAMACQGGGIGAAGGASLSGTVTNAPPTSGVSYYKGVTTDVGLVANGAVTVLSESNGVDDPMHISATLSGGLGGGEFTGFITCQQYTKCIVN